MLGWALPKNQLWFFGSGISREAMVQQIAGSPAIFAAPVSWLTLLLQVVGNAPAEHGPALH